MLRCFAALLVVAEQYFVVGFLRDLVNCFKYSSLLP